MERSLCPKNFSLTACPKQSKSLPRDARIKEENHVHYSSLKLNCKESQ
jgi:hypothetical protein